MNVSATLLALSLALIPVTGMAQSKAGNPEPAAKPAAKAPAKATAKTLTWVPLEDGIKRASASGKYVFVTVYTDWCGYCRKLNNVTFKAAPVLAELEKNFQSVRINAESPKTVVWEGKRMSERDVAGREWGVTGYPTMLFLSPKGEIIGSYSAYAEPDMMVKLLTYISSGARERKVSFEDFIEGKG
jgi:thioredoxin-related protein